MKVIALGSIFVLFAIVGGLTVPTAFAAEVSVSVPEGTSLPGCEETNVCWDPPVVNVNIGDTVTWSNDDTAAHTVTSGTPGDSESVGAIFDSGLFMIDAVWSNTFDEAGTFDYFCMVHPWMAGVVIVGEAMAEEGIMEGEIMISIEAEPAAAGETTDVTVTITNMDGSSTEHVNYDIMATQGGEVVLDEKGVHDHDGVMTHPTMTLPMAASDEMPVDVTVTFNGFGIDPPFTGPIGEGSTMQVVPEFGTITMMNLGVGIVSIIAISAKSRVILKI